MSVSVNCQQGFYEELDVSSLNCLVVECRMLVNCSPTCPMFGFSEWSRNFLNIWNYSSIYFGGGGDFADTFCDKQTSIYDYQTLYLHTGLNPCLVDNTGSIHGYIVYLVLIEISNFIFHVHFL